MTPLLRPLGPEDVSDRARAIFEDFLRERGNIPNMFRTLAHRPAILETAFAHFRAVMAKDGAVPLRVKELVALAVSFANDCDYCAASHSKLALQLGVTEELLNGLKRGDLAKLDKDERAAVELARAMAQGGKGVPRSLTDAVKGAYGEAGLLEVVAVAGLFHYFNRFNNTLEVEVTK
jgi:uncharacterized peroxidase-related enzyme